MKEPAVPANFAADDFSTIRKNMCRNRVIELCASIGLQAGNRVPDAIMLAAGYTAEEIAKIPTVQRTLPINDGDLR